MSTPNKAVLMVERWSCSHCGREGEVEYPSTVGCEESNELVAAAHAEASKSCRHIPRSGKREVKR